MQHRKLSRGMLSRRQKSTFTRSARPSPSVSLISTTYGHGFRFTIIGKAGINIFKPIYRITHHVMPTWSLTLLTTAKQVTNTGTSPEPGAKPASSVKSSASKRSTRSRARSIKSQNGRDALVQPAKCHEAHNEKSVAFIAKHTRGIGSTGLGSLTLSNDRLS